MISRPFWQQRVEEAWREAPIVWLAGVRRSGKTTLAESLGVERVLYHLLSRLIEAGCRCVKPLVTNLPFARVSFLETEK